MSVNLNVEINVKIGDASVYESKSVIPVDQSFPTPFTIDKKQADQSADVNAGTKKWLKLFAINLPPLENDQPYKGLSFRTADREGKESAEIPLTGPVAYWGKSLDQLFGPNQYLDKVIFTNDGSCDVIATIYIGRDVAAHKPADEPCPKKAT